MPSLDIEPGPHWWETSALTTTSPLLSITLFARIQIVCCFSYYYETVFRFRSSFLLICCGCIFASFWLSLNKRGRDDVVSCRLSGSGIVKFPAAFFIWYSTVVDEASTVIKLVVFFRFCEVHRSTATLQIVPIYFVLELNDTVKQNLLCKTSPSTFKRFPFKYIFSSFFLYYFKLWLSKQENPCNFPACLPKSEGHGKYIGDLFCLADPASIRSPRGTSSEKRIVLQNANFLLPE